MSNPKSKPKVVAEKESQKVIQTLKIENNENNQIITVEKIKEIEKVLDRQVPNYSKYTKCNPMACVCWEKNRVKFRYRTKNIVKYGTLDEIKKIYLLSNEPKDLINVNDSNLYKSYNNKLVSYLYNNFELFDIFHVLNIIGIRFQYRKKNMLIELSKYYKIVENIYGGCYIKYFVDKNTLIFILHQTKNKSEICEALGLNILNSFSLYKEDKNLSCIVKTFSGENMINQYSKNIFPYRIDLYFPDYKLAIECDENGHKNRNKLYELERELYIKNQLKCKFIRFNPDDKEFNIFNLINIIYSHIKYYKEIETCQENFIIKATYLNDQINNFLNNIDKIKFDHFDKFLYEDFMKLQDQNDINNNIIKLPNNQNMYDLFNSIDNQSIIYDRELLLKKMDLEIAKIDMQKQHESKNNIDKQIELEKLKLEQLKIQLELSKIKN